jgi:DNA-nicking Smr family endonuclease
MKSDYFNDPFLSILPKLDLHGETRDVVRYLVLEFINSNKKMGNYKLQIIHGRSGGILKTETHEVLKSCKDVEKYYIYNMNDGVTIVELKKIK